MAPSGAAVASPSAPSVAPPGSYLLFILNLSSNDFEKDGVIGSDFVPSVGSIVQIGSPRNLHRGDPGQS